MLMYSKIVIAYFWRKKKAHFYSVTEIKENIDQVYYKIGMYKLFVVIDCQAHSTIFQVKLLQQINTLIWSTN